MRAMASLLTEATRPGGGPGSPPNHASGNAQRHGVRKIGSPPAAHPAQRPSAGLRHTCASLSLPREGCLPQMERASEGLQYRAVFQSQREDRALKLGDLPTVQREAATHGAPGEPFPEMK